MNIEGLHILFSKIYTNGACFGNEIFFRFCIETFVAMSFIN